MNAIQQINSTIQSLYNDSKNDFLKVAPALAKGIFRPMGPSDFKNAYLAISTEQGEHLIELIKDHNLKNIVEFGTSFGISTLFLAQGVLETNGNIITTELLASKAKKAQKNFEDAGVDHLIDLRVGDALESLKDHNTPIDLLLLDGWKDLYLPLFNMLKHNFHKGTFVYVDNADMPESRDFLKVISQNPKYVFDKLYNGKVAIIRVLG